MHIFQINDIFNFQHLIHTMSPQNKTTFSPFLPKLLFLFGFLIYANTLTHDYALDDAIVITDNQYTQDGLAGLKGIFSYDTFYGFFKEEGKSKLVAGGRYRPLSLATFAVEISIFGASPFVSHIVNALLFALCGYLVFYVLNEILYMSNVQSLITDPNVFPYNSTDWGNVVETIFYSPSQNGTDPITQNNLYQLSTRNSLGDIPPLVYNYGEKRIIKKF